ncbi:DUF4157 domain-containing protein [Reinekea sp. G2M2-21]|uniref:eCIS core domain-containing protein n=1 Tax=Reinekea sp. G2M2-21 TaxID=2788942 RepID=UPI0018AABA50|nr:DUF4157 domain-containing protein [Reinekea sp. G2M2-21]
MHVHAAPSKEQAKQPPIKESSQTSVRESETFQFVDNRPAVSMQTSLAEMADNSLQGSHSAQLKTVADSHIANIPSPVQKKDNPNGLPESLKTGIESLSGLSMDGVDVHRNSDKPAQLNAHAYAQGTEIHVASGQDKHLPHEAWHVVQQKQGRVQPTINVGGAAVNDNTQLETEADVMGAKAASVGQSLVQKKSVSHPVNTQANNSDMTTLSFASQLRPVQRVTEPPLQRKRDRDKDEETVDASQLKQLKQDPVQRVADVTQLAIADASEAPPGTRIMVTNPVASDTGDVGRVIRLSSSKPNCMAVEFDNERGVLYRVYFNEINVLHDTADKDHNTEADKLKLMMDQAIKAAIGAVDALNDVMSADETNAPATIVAPAAQLQKCIDDCAGLSAEKTATYLYTTYFYGPLNRYLRNPGVRLPSAAVQGLIDVTHAFLQRAFNNTAGAKLLPKFRMELQAEWIDNAVPGDTAETGDALTFKAFTSTHPLLSGVNGMWPDIEKGSFGAVTKLALLVFQGDSKFLYPSAKYFPSEHEHILPPEMHTKITEKYQIHWTDYRKDIDDPKRIWTVTVYHLTIEGSGDVDKFKLYFGYDGNIYSYKT